MNRCDECKHKDSCVCVPYGCECFELDLEEHDKQIYNQALSEFMEQCYEYKDLTFEQEHIERLEIIKNSLTK